MNRVALLHKLAIVCGIFALAMFARLLLHAKERESEAQLAYINEGSATINRLDREWQGLTTAEDKVQEAEDALEDARRKAGGKWLSAQERYDNKHPDHERLVDLSLIVLMSVAALGCFVYGFQARKPV